MLNCTHCLTKQRNNKIGPIKIILDFSKIPIIQKVTYSVKVSTNYEQNYGLLNHGIFQIDITLNIFMNNFLPITERFFFFFLKKKLIYKIAASFVCTLYV